MYTRFILTGLALSTLAGCGFEPMYGTTRFSTPTTQQVAIEKQLSQIAIANIPDRKGQVLRNELIDRFYRHGRPETPLYTLRVGNLDENIDDLDITKESDATRAQLRMSATMTLQDSSGQIVLTRNLISIGSYNILTSEFATRVSEGNTRENVLKDLAAQIELQIGLYLQKQTEQ